MTNHTAAACQEPSCRANLPRYYTHIVPEKGRSFHAGKWNIHEGKCGIHKGKWNIHEGKCGIHDQDCFIFVRQYLVLNQGSSVSDKIKIKERRLHYGNVW